MEVKYPTYVVVVTSEGAPDRASSQPPRLVQVALDYFGVTLTVIALIAGAIAVAFGGDPAQTMLRFALGIGAGVGGIFAASGHLFRAADTAKDMQWPVGTPWQTEVGFADLALGVASVVAAFSRSPGLGRSQPSPFPSSSSAMPSLTFLTFEGAARSQRLPRSRFRATSSSPPSSSCYVSWHDE